jgi:hypothetical protein
VEVQLLVFLELVLNLHVDGIVKHVLLATVKGKGIARTERIRTMKPW